MNSEKHIEAITLNALNALFPGSNVKRVDEDTSLTKTELVAVIGFSGDLVRGVAGISAAPAVVEALHPSAGFKASLSEAELADWTGELANQLLGRLKIAMLSSGVDFWMATPVVLKGVAVSVASSRETVKRYRHDSSAGTLWVWVDLEFDERVEFDNKEPKTSDEAIAPAAGDFLLF